MSHSYSKILFSHGLDHELFLLGGKCILNCLQKSGLKHRLLYCLGFKIFHDVQANLPETSPFLSVQMAV